MAPPKNDALGDAAGPRAATPGTYGEAPRGYRLPNGISLGPVHLQIADLARSLRFYETALGLRVLQREGPRAVLAARASDLPLVELHERPGAREVPLRGRTGLYHFALLVPDRASLGRFERHLGEINARFGSADHLVSESLYLQDPDNLGIEVYADRPRRTWQRVGRELMMATDPLDLAGLVRAGSSTPWSGLPAGTVMGHVHLHVADLALGQAFFSEALGFDRTVWHYPGALFFAADGYHHHLGTNTWAGPGATPPAAEDAQLLEWTIELPDASALEAAAENLVRAGHPVDRTEASSHGLARVTRDPWGTPIRLALRSPTSSRARE
jgi:catechol 2,3-dioxygenase